MFSRLNQVGRHLATSLPSASRASTPYTASGSFLGIGKMAASSVEDRSKRLIHTAGCIIIGDEVLGGKTVDTNSAYFAKFCFSLGINLKRIEVIADDEAEIIEATRRMSSDYDLIVTSGGIGPTHDDITYQSIAKAFGLELKLYRPALEKMKKLSTPHPSQLNFSWDEPSPALEAKLRMVRLPIDGGRAEDDQALFPDSSLWVPVSVVNGNVHILPGVPRLFEKLVDGMKGTIMPRLADPEGKGAYRLLISTPMPESAVAGYLTELAARVESKGIKVGSYPRWEKSRNTVTLVGRDRELMDSLVPEVEKNVQGIKVEREDEADDRSEEEAT